MSINKSLLVNNNAEKLLVELTNSHAVPVVLMDGSGDILPFDDLAVVSWDDTPSRTAANNALITESYDAVKYPSLTAYKVWGERGQLFPHATYNNTIVSAIIKCQGCKGFYIGVEVTTIPSSGSLEFRILNKHSFISTSLVTITDTGVVTTGNRHYLVYPSLAATPTNINKYSDMPALEELAVVIVPSNANDYDVEVNYLTLPA